MSFAEGAFAPELATGKQGGTSVQQVEVAVIGTGWCGGIRAETLSRSSLVDKLHNELLSVVGRSEFKNQIVNGGMLPMDNPSAERLQDFVKSEIVRWGAVVRRAGLAGSE